MAPRSSRWRRLRKRLNRRFYRCLVGLYRAAFPTRSPRRPIPAGTLRRILVVQHYGVGDMILTTPMLSYLKERAPEAEVDVVASPRNAGVIAGDPCVARVYVHDHTWRTWLRILPRLRARRYDAIFSGQVGKGLREGLTASAIAGRHAQKVSVWRAKRYHGLFTTLVRVPPSITHTADRLLYMAHHALGGGGPRPTADTYPPRIATDERAEAVAAAHRRARGLSRYIVVNVAAHFAQRDWAPAACAAFLAVLLDRHPELAVVLTRPPAKGDQADETARLSADPRVAVAPALPLLAVAGLVRHAVAVVTTDTALVHVASACRRPVIALYAPVAPSDVTLWLPVGVPHRVLTSRLGGAVADIPPERVAEAFDDLLRAVQDAGDAASAPAEASSW